LGESPFPSATSNEENLECFELIQKFLSKNFEQKNVDESDSFRVQEWLKTTVGNCDKASAVFECKDNSYVGLAIAVNVEDHLQMHISGKSFKQTLKTLISAHNYINDYKSFAFDSKHGYLTVDPKLCGNALRFGVIFSNIEDETVKNSKGELQ